MAAQSQNMQNTPKSYRFIYCLSLSWEQDELGSCRELQCVCNALSKDLCPLPRAIPSQDPITWLSNTMRWVRNELPNDEFLPETLFVLYMASYGSLDECGDFVFSPYFHEPNESELIPTLPWEAVEAELSLVPSDIFIVLDGSESAAVLDTLSPLPSPLISARDYYFVRSLPSSRTPILTAQYPLPPQPVIPPNLKNRIEVIAAALTHGNYPTTFTTLLLEELRFVEGENISVEELHNRIVARFSFQKKQRVSIEVPDTGYDGDDEDEDEDVDGHSVESVPIFLRMKGRNHQPSIPIRGESYGC